MRRLRRDAQDVTITPEIIDKLLDQIDFIVELDLTGGEPFLHPEIIEYLFDGIIKRDIFLFGAGSVTNGTICDQRVADGLPFLTAGKGFSIVDGMGSEIPIKMLPEVF